MKIRKPWQVAVRSRMFELGIGYRELAEAVGASYDTVRQVVTKDVSPGIKKRICEYLEVAEE